MPQALGFIDGTHIPIRRPLESSQDYFNYKGFHSISVQAICDSKGIFMDVDCKWPGSLHDAKVFSNSTFNFKIISNSIPITYRELLPGFCKVPCYVIDDPAYPLSTFCLKEYLHCQNKNQVVFNTLLRTARNQIECAFGRLKARWAILKKKIDLKLENIPTVIYACFVLHNFCKIKCITVDEEVFINNIKENINSDKVDSIYSCNTDEGSLIREVITQYISGCNNNSI
nr:putative nuclease HARBI1 [Hydra vulgaris]